MGGDAIGSLMASLEWWVMLHLRSLHEAARSTPTYIDAILMTKEQIEHELEEHQKKANHLAASVSNWLAGEDENVTAGLAPGVSAAHIAKQVGAELAVHELVDVLPSPLKDDKTTRLAKGGGWRGRRGRRGRKDSKKKISRQQPHPVRHVWRYWTRG
jgi:hypothetical protein